ncbi:MAG: YybS family protein [Desulfobacterales bacterium]|nr:YybS family protein [Desulfobacterales bacterium]
MPKVVTGQSPTLILSGIVITALLFAAAVMIPFFGVFAVLVIPLPVLFYRLKLGRFYGGIVPAAAFLLWLGQTGGLTADLFFFLGQLVMGFSLGECLERRLPIEKTIGVAAGVVFLAAICTLFLYTNAAGLDIGVFLSDYIKANLAVYQEAYKTLDMPSEQMQALSVAFEHAPYVIVRILPGICMAAALFGAWINLLLARPLLKVGCPDIERFERLNQWKAPEHFVWGIIGFGVLLLIPEVGIKLTGFNGLIVLLPVYFFQGIAIVSFYFNKKRLPAAMKWFLYSMIALQIYALILVIGLGIFDIWLDFRKLKQPTETNGVS